LKFILTIAEKQVTGYLKHFADGKKIGKSDIFFYCHKNIN